jgi:hypothetical protein
VLDGRLPVQALGHHLLVAGLDEVGHGLRDVGPRVLETAQTEVSLGGQELSRGADLAGGALDQPDGDVGGALVQRPIHRELELDELTHEVPALARRREQVLLARLEKELERPAGPFRDQLQRDPRRAGASGLDEVQGRPADPAAGELAEAQAGGHAGRAHRSGSDPQPGRAGTGPLQLV